MGFDAKKYLRKTMSLSRKIENIQDQELYMVYKKGGKIIGIAPTPELELLTLQGGFGKIRRFERWTISGDTLEFLRFSFNLIPNDSAVFRIRIDKEGLNGDLPHVNRQTTGYRIAKPHTEGHHHQPLAQSGKTFDKSILRYCERKVHKYSQETY